MTVSEGYYSLAPVCVALGSVFLLWGWRTAAQLQVMYTLTDCLLLRHISLLFFLLLLIFL